MPYLAMKILSGGRLTLPKDWMKQNGIDVGDEISLKITKNYIIVSPPRAINLK